jgi:hypothetical protein
MKAHLKLKKLLTTLNTRKIPLLLMISAHSYLCSYFRVRIFLNNLVDDARFSVSRGIHIEAQFFVSLSVLFIAAERHQVSRHSIGAHKRTDQVLASHDPLRL